VHFEFWRAAGFSSSGENRRTVHRASVSVACPQEIGLSSSRVMLVRSTKQYDHLGDLPC
jgi:hypothetical protein